MQNIIFATGIEGSYPTVQGGERRDQLEETRHYEHWRQDFQLCIDALEGSRRLIESSISPDNRGVSQQPAAQDHR